MPNGMSSILTSKINWLAENTAYELHMILTERPDLPWAYTMSPKVKWVNFDINFDRLDTMPLPKKIYHYVRKQRRYKRLLSDYLMSVKPHITVTALRREINFINDIADGSVKIGEIHFSKHIYRKFSKPYLPRFANDLVTRLWTDSLLRQVRRLDTFVVLTNEDAALWPKLDNLKVIPNFLTTAADGRKSDCTSKKVMAAGRYEYQKGFDLLIAAWAKIHPSHPEWTLDIYGNGNVDAYKALAEQGNVGDSIVCHSATSDIREKMLQASVFVLSSRSEGFGLVVIEAMSAGLPVVSFACPCGPRDIIEDGTSGLLVENGDIDQLANAMAKLMDDAQLRLSMASSALERSHHYDKDRTMAIWQQLFDSVAK